jgi:hypothetical protein
MRTVTEKPAAFNRVFMLQTGVKLLLYVAYVAICLFTVSGHHVAFVIHFFAVYLFFATFDILLILKFVRDNSGQKPDNIEKYN